MTMERAVPEPSLVGHYAGAVTRVVAYAIDSTLSVAVYAAGISLAIYVLNLVTGIDASRQDIPAWLWSIGLALWLWLYFGYSWAMSGQTVGMAIVGLRVVQRDGARLSAGKAVLRVPALAVTLFLTLGIGFIGILIGRERRGLQDVLAGSVVVYSWDARTARLRFLTRGAEKKTTPAEVHPA